MISNFFGVQDDDTITGGVNETNIFISGGTGNDLLTAGDDNTEVRIQGGANSDTISGGKGSTTYTAFGDYEYGAD